MSTRSGAPHRRIALSRVVASVAVAVSLAACTGENNPPSGRVTFVNDTDVPIATIYTGVEQGLDSWFDRAGYLTDTREPGASWLTGLEYADVEEGMWCMPLYRIWFVTPLDPDDPTIGRATGQVWSADDVAVVGTIDEPCFEQDGQYRITPG